MSVPLIELVENDLLPFITIEWEDKVITGYTTELHVLREDGTSFTRTGIIDDDGASSNAAIFHFEWQAGDLVRGEHEAQVEVTDTGAKNETLLRLSLSIEKDLG
jgi:hypothetical protein